MAAMGLPGSFFSGAVEREEREQQREAEAEAHEERVRQAWGSTARMGGSRRRSLGRRTEFGVDFPKRM